MELMCVVIFGGRKGAGGGGFGGRDGRDGRDGRGLGIVGWRCLKF